MGIGWGGIHAVNYMIKAHISDVEFWAIDPDIAMLSRRAAAPNSLQIGSGLSRPFNLSDIAWGEMLANESRDEIARVLEETDLVFIVASIGNDTAFGAASVIAEVAKEMGVLTIGVVNRSFFNSQIEPLKSRVDTLIIVPSYRRGEITTEQDSMLEDYYDRFLYDYGDIIYDLLRQAVQSISDLVTSPGLMKPDFVDVCALMRDKGAALIGVGISSGESRAKKAAKAAISSPFLECSLEEAQGFTIHISGSSNLTLQEVNAAIETINKFVNQKAHIVVGATIDNRLQNNVRVTVIATGVKYLGIYKKLSNLLAQGKWEEADNETANIMFKLSKQAYEMSSEYVKTVPTTEFHTIFWKSYHKLNFSLDAPIGHLPVVFPSLNQYRGFDEQNIVSILSRFEFYFKVTRMFNSCS
ncbi:MAG: GUN4 domain-containing protein [Scytonema sp. PMC 1069.18]|nr:GUN4 domain-containing protein [Scytonema sp. PMC 1069.18]MEC4888067.1 GUN4 domain-containing protein [Scytonema sp. PMC 1070.18]